MTQMITTAEASPATIRRPFPRLRLTAFGGVVVAMVAITLLMASNYSNNLLYVVVYIWVALILTSGIRTLLQFRWVQTIGWQHDELFANTANPIRLRLNRENFIGELFLQGNQSLPEDQRCTWQATPENSGWVSLSPISLCANDPLKFWCFSQPLAPLTNRLVLPCPIAHRALNDYLSQANSQDKEPEDIAGFREYQPGDDYRHIDWSATARAGKIISRQWEGNQVSAVFWLNWNDLSSLSVRERQETLTAWILTLFERGHDWGLQLPSIKFNPDSTWQHRSHCLQAIAELS
jgi:uncharacterized protein (DUF58 family)